MKRVLPMLLVTIAMAACSRASGPSSEPIDKMFDVRYEKFISAAKAHKGGCEISLSAKGDGGSKNDGVSATVEVDDEGGFRLELDGGFEVVRVGSVAWQRSRGEKFERVESGARADLLRDDSIVGWRDVLLPLKSRMTLSHADSAKLGERDIDVYDIAVEQGGGADGSVEVKDGKGKVSLDEETGFPVAIEFEGSWEGAATAPATGRVTWTVEKMECAVSGIGGVEAITPAIATPTPTPAQTAAPATTATAKPAATPTAKPAATKKPTTKPGR